LASALLAAIVESSDDAIASKTLDGIVTSWNRAAERLFGYTAEELIGRPIAILAAPDRGNEMPAILERIRRGERVDHYETVRKSKDGSLVEISLSVSPVRNAQGRIIGASEIARDITERRRAERERELHYGEIRHWVKNLLAMVRALARRTEGHSGEQYRVAFLSRLEAFAVAHELAFVAEGSADLATLVRRVLEPYAGERAAVVVEEAGPAVTLATAKVQALALVLHELATNAVKYGALSVPKGRVRIGWELVEGADGPRRLRLRWVERGGPWVKRPKVRGFGTELVEYVAASELGRPVKLTFAPEGLAAEITVVLG